MVAGPVTINMEGTAHSEADWSEADWRDLLRLVQGRKVVPVVGPELVVIPTPEGGGASLYRLLAPKLADALGLRVENVESASFNRVACQHLLGGGRRLEIYSQVAALIDALDAPPPAALCDLAAIADFDLYLTSTIDPLLERALQMSRPGFDAERHVGAYDYSDPKDLPEQIGDALVYHLLGSPKTFPNFAVWEEDYLAFICGYVQHDAQLKRFFRLLRSRYLLLLGAPFTDWIVRFFLFVVQGGRFSDRRNDVRAYLSDRPENLGEPLVFFFDQVVGTTRIIRGNPADFTRELARRWRAARDRTASGEEILAEMPDEMPRDSVFVSYAREDRDAMAQLVRGLHEAGVPVWVDQQRLRAGENYERGLEFAVKNRCSFFLSLISRATERDPARFVHTERRWAAERHVDGYVFYIPVIIDDVGQPRLEPAKVGKSQFERLPGGVVSKAFASRMRQLVEDFRKNGPPSG